MDGERRDLMRFPDPNLGYVFGYRGAATGNGIEAAFLGGRVRIVFRPGPIRSAWPETYEGGRISWSVIRFGRSRAVRGRCTWS